MKTAPLALLLVAAQPATAGGYVAPIFDVPPPLPAPAAPSATWSINPYAVGVTLLIGLCAAHVICPEGSGRDPHGDDRPEPPPVPVPPEPAPVPLPGGAGLLALAMGMLGLRRKQRSSAVRWSDGTVLPIDDGVEMKPGNAGCCAGVDDRRWIACEDAPVSAVETEAEVEARRSRPETMLFPVLHPAMPQPPAPAAFALLSARHSLLLQRVEALANDLERRPMTVGVAITRLRMALDEAR